MNNTAKYMICAVAAGAMLVSTLAGCSCISDILEEMIRRLIFRM